ncbi:MAG: hypothetical protein ACI87O_001179, partial [Planctomycetota bacterium]
TLKGDGLVHMLREVFDGRDSHIWLMSGKRFNF